MRQIGKWWAGRAYGTNTGNLFVGFAETEGGLKGQLRILDEQFGPAVYAVEGSFENELDLQGTWESGGEADAHGVLTIKGALTQDGAIRGTWASTIGTGGTFVLHPHDFRPGSAATDAAAVPEQLFTRNIQIGAIRLYPNDVLDLLRFVKEDFISARPVVTYRLRGSEVTKYADQFVTDLQSTGVLDYLKITNQEPDAYAINKVVIVEFSAFGANEIRVQGVRESWVIGRAQALAEHLKQFESPLVTNYRKFGLNINSIIFFLMLITIPEIETLGARTFFVAAVLTILAGLLWLHRKLIPNASIVLGRVEPSALARLRPTLLSWLGAVSASVVAAFIFWWLTK
jgi:hypothetical protein